MPSKKKSMPEGVSSWQPKHCDFWPFSFSLSDSDCADNMNDEQDNPPTTVPTVIMNHAPDAVPPLPPEKAMEPIINIAERLLGLRGSPPYVLFSIEWSTICLSTLLVIGT
mgnify:CR=1 FL=1